MRARTFRAITRCLVKSSSHVSTVNVIQQLEGTQLQTKTCCSVLLLYIGSYRAIKLLEQPMKVLESVEKEDQMSGVNDNMQFGFMPGKGTTDAIFIMRQVQEKHQTKKKKLYYAFVDLEKAFDRVPREIVR